MLFNSLNFLIFLPIVMLIYFLVPKKASKYWLLVASYYFYMNWNAKYALLLLASTTVTYVGGLLIERQSKKSVQKLIVSLSLVINLGILFFFKYFFFGAGILTRILSMAHINMNVPEFDIILPVGISFYVFQALGYTIDVYRKDISAEKNFFKYALFVSFFPQLVAGPIERSSKLLPQLDERKKFSFEAAEKGLMLMLWGFFLKIVLADRIAIFVDSVYGDTANYPGFFIVVATILFGIQIYCDFYGYSIIAVGAAKMIGIDLMENFNAPYLATSVAGFWKGWHISLTTWFRDYLYIPLGGNKKGKFRTQLNKMIVFLVSGLWHGASFSYVIWGGLNGLYQVIGSLLRPVKEKLCRVFRINRELIVNKIICGIVTFALVDFSWLFFRAKDTASAFSVLKAMVSVNNINILYDKSLFGCGLNKWNFLFMLFCIAILLFADICKKKGYVIHRTLLAQKGWLKCIIIAAVVVFLLTFGKYGPAYDANSFIYFQF